MSPSITPLPKHLLHARCQPSLCSGSLALLWLVLTHCLKWCPQGCRRVRRVPLPRPRALIYRVLNRVSEASEEDLSPLVGLDGVC